MDKWLKRYRVISRSVLAFSLWWMYRCGEAAMAWAFASDKDGMAIAAIVAAVTAPASLLFGSVFKTYAENSPNVRDPVQ